MIDKRLRTVLGVSGFLVLAAVAGAQAELSTVAGVVIEKSRTFGLQQITLRPGGSVVLRNEEPTAVHHPYIESAGLTRDFGDQEPGSQTIVTFPDRGTFEVGCGVHAKMKLIVVVQ